MRKLASIVEIADTNPIPETERLDVVTMKGKSWRVVTGRNEFKKGDIAVYFEIDSALPIDDERYSFLHDRCLKTWHDKQGNKIKECVRIRTIKLRGIISQGLLIPIHIFHELSENVIGDDVTSVLRVEHFDEIQEQMRAMLDTRTRSTGRREGNFPTFIPKTDEERIQNLADWPEKMKGIKWEVTEKNDGSSMTVFYSPSLRPDNPFGVCSRNFELKRDETNAWWEAAIKYDLESKLKSLENEELALQGELVGPGMNGNRDLYPEREFHVFRIWDIANQCYMTSKERVELCIKLDIPHVKIISEEMDVFGDFPTIDDILKFAEGVTDRGHEREGLVFKEANSNYPRSFKAVSNRYLMKMD